VNRGLRPTGLELRRVGSWHEDTRAFIPFTATLAAAQAAGLSVPDYIDRAYNLPGATEMAVEKMRELGAFEGRTDRICEIGPGSGRYLTRIRAICQPSHYEIYETAPDWAEWLVEQHGVVLQATDGRTLAATPSRSVDLVHAQKVFEAVPTVTALGYLCEMARVVRAGGRIVFDAMTEGCLDPLALERWCSAGALHGIYPAALPRAVVLEVLESRGLRLRGSFFLPMKPGSIECFVFAFDGAPAPLGQT
jgi:SAM-dependent methyltransferase